MALQRIFTPEYVNLLTNDIKVENYVGESIKYDDSQVRRLKGIEKPEGLEEKMLNAPSKFDAAIILYESFKDITPTLAANSVLWVYLSHVDLVNYVRREWPDLEKYESDNKKNGVKKGQTRSDDDRKKYIRDLWLISQNGPMRTSLMNMWWSVYLTVDESLGDEHKYDLTKIFFSNDG